MAMAPLPDDRTPPAIDLQVERRSGDETTRRAQRAGGRRATDARQGRFRFDSN
jgi:hypothetical protein